MGFGPHLMVDCFHFDEVDKLYNLDHISRFLLELAKDIEMTPISEPRVLLYDGGGNPEEKGITGNLIIAESHINIHTFPAKDHAFVDVFSCKNFNIDDALEFIALDLECDYDRFIVKRGMKFRR